MATKKQDAPESVEAFVLRDCAFGKCSTVVTLPAATAKQAADLGMVDLNPAAIAAAKG